MEFRAMSLELACGLRTAYDPVTKMLSTRLVHEFHFGYNLPVIISFREKISGGLVIATHQYFVAVIGAGPAGLFGARELAN